MQVSIIVLVHNGLKHVKNLLENRKVKGVDAEWIILNNGSDIVASNYLNELKSDNLQLLKSDTNLYFAKGNNLASKSAKGQYLLLLNSDIIINDENWLLKLLSVHKRGSTGLGVLNDPIRSDGFCYLIDKDLYGDGIDESFEWWWGITKLQSKLLSEGHSVQAIKSYPEITHVGQGSGKTPAFSSGMNINKNVVNSWFENLPKTVILENMGQKPIKTRYDLINNFIKNRNYNSYLEIGLGTAFNFDKINCKLKISIDPNPKKMIISNIKCTSDEYFEKHSDKFDIIFIDGLHTEDQVMRDIDNSLLHLNSNGMIVVHDVLPTTEWHQRDKDNGGVWNGTVWKAVLRMFQTIEHLCYVVDTDWGCAVIDTSKPRTHTPISLPLSLIYDRDFNLLDQYKVVLLANNEIHRTKAKLFI